MSQKSGAIRGGGTRAGVTGVALLLLVTGVGVQAAQAEEVPTPPCAGVAVLPTIEAVKGMEAHGLTVETGVDPDPFTAKILGRITDGIAPGVDMIIADVASVAVQKAGGIWAGMSGSPVYTEDGKLIGAIAYGLATTASPIAGITPAADMMKLMNRGTGSVTPASGAALSASMTSTVVATGDVTAGEAAGGMRELSIPLSIAGVNAKHAKDLTASLTKRAPGVRVFTAGAAGAESAAADPADVVPGGNFAAAIAYGDISAVATGTTTMVCDGKAVAFGHPFFFNGATKMSAHTADAVYVQADGFVPFKVANPGGIVGTLDQDRLAGIRATLGAGPASVPVVSTITSDGESRTGTTRINVPEFVPDIAASHVFSNIDRVIDRIGAGTSNMHWVITGKRADGETFTIEGANRYASGYDISYESVGQLAGILAAIEYSEYEDAHVTGVQVDGDVSEAYTYDAITAVSIREPDGTYTPLKGDTPLAVETGSRLNLRVTLKPYKGIGGLRYKDVTVIVPANMANSMGGISISGGGSGYYDGGWGDEESGPVDFDAMLQDLGTVVPGNSFDVRLALPSSESGDGYASKLLKRQTTEQVTTGEINIPLVVMAPGTAGPGVVDATRWSLRPTMSAGTASSKFTFGTTGDVFLAGDFDGDGAKSAATFRNGAWTIQTGAAGTPPLTFTFGQAGDVPLVGDWNGDGIDTVGVWRAGRWLLRNSLTEGAADKDFTWGATNATPVVGDWDGDGIDTPGTFAAGTWTVRKYGFNSGGIATFVFGSAGDTPVVGDWEGDGRDEPGLFRAGKWTKRTSLASGLGKSFLFGSKTGKPVVWTTAPAPIFPMPIPTES